MARFDDQFIERLKSETDIVRLVESYGTKLKDRGNGELIGLCPIHDDKNPSLVVNRKKNVWNCLGACGRGGDPIEWVMVAEKASFRHAVELLKDGATGTGGGKKFTTERKLDCPLTIDVDDVSLLGSVCEYYHQRLKESPQALQYLQSRGITDHETIDTFQIGFVDRTLGLRLPAKQIKAGAEIRQRLRNIGILRDSGHEHLRGCITFPLRNDQEQVVQVYGRRVDNGQGRTASHFYLPRSHGGVFNRAAFQAADEIILCESVIDALTFWNAGFRNVSTIYGTNGFTDDMQQSLVAHNIKRILLALDNDEAGNKAATSLAEQLTSDNFEVFRIKFPAGMDANEYSLKVTPAEQSLSLVIRKAEWFAQVKANSAPTSTQAAKEERKPTSNEPNNANEEVNSSSLAASPVPRMPKDINAEVSETEISIQLGNRRYRIRGLGKNLSYDQLKINLLVEKGELVHVDTFDLYAARPRAAFVKVAALELGIDENVIKRDVGRVLLKLEELQDQQIAAALKPKDSTPTLTDEETSAALELLKSPNLMQRILDDFDTAGVVGEETNKLVGYLAAVSRKLDKPLAVVIQSSSSAGKSSLMDAVLKLMPSEEQIKYSAMTGQSLFYMGETNLKHKILAIAEDEGVEQAAYALKLLQSEGELKIASAGKDSDTGRLGTQEYHVEGPVMIFLTTTSSDIDEELMNRCIVLAVDEDRAQTRAIHERQRAAQTLKGLLASRNANRIVKLHQDAQRLLRPLVVVNPFALQLTFQDNKTRTRRDHMKYLSLIQTIALLHQYQRPIRKTECGGEVVQYIEITAHDIALANGLASVVLGRTLDELSPQTRRLLILLHDMVVQRSKELGVERDDYRFTRRDVREAIGWTDFQVRTHLTKLVELEYVLVHRGRRGQQFVYELLYDGQGREGQPFLMGLIDPAKIQGYDPKFEGFIKRFEPSAEDLEPSAEDLEPSAENLEPSSSIQSVSIEARLRSTKNDASRGQHKSNGKANGKPR